MGDAVIIAGCRTPIGTAFKGTLATTSAFALAEAVVREVVERAGLPTDAYDDVILGESLYGGGDIARHAAVEAGLTDVPGAAVNRHCASGLAAVALAAGSIRAGMDRVVVAGGTHSTSTMPQSRWRSQPGGEWADDWMSPSHPDRPDAPNRDMSITVGWNTAQALGLTREEMDRWALRSHQRAVAAQEAGKFDDELVALKVLAPDGSSLVFDRDEHPRPGSSMERLAKLAPLHPEIEGFSITAGNSSGLNDGAAALVVADVDVATALGARPLARVRSWASVGVDPARTGLAPISVIPKALSRAGLGVDDVDLFEINEAFASVALGTTRELGIDEEKVNFFGSGCSLGHPIAASGARMIVTLVHELRRRGGGVGVAAMCAGGGMGGAVVIEVLS
jgi:acetyl-CoA C-acetyltransferase